MSGALDAVGDLASSFDDLVNDVVPGGWATVGAAALIYAGVTDPELLSAAEDGTLTSSQLAEAGVTTAEAQAAAQVAADAAAGYIPADAYYVGDQVYAANGAHLGSVADFGQTAVATDGGYMISNPDATWFQPVAAATAAPEVAVATPVISGSVIETALPSWAETAAAGAGAVAPEVAATEAAGAVAPAVAAPTALPPDVQAVLDQHYGGGGGTFEWEGQTWVNTPQGPETLDYLQQQADFFKAQEAAQAGSAIPSTAIPTVDAAGNAGYFDTATGQTLNSAGQVIAEAPVAPAGAGTTIAEATQAGTEAGVASDVPYRVDVSGAAGTAEAPGYVSGPLTEGTQLATQAEIDAGTAQYNAAANAWEVPTVAAPVAPAATTGLTAGETAALAGGGALATGALGGGGSAGAVTTVAPTTTAPATTGGTTTTTPPATTTTPVTPVAPVETPLTPPKTEVIPPGSSTVTPVEATPPEGVTTPEAAAAAGYDAATIAKWVAAGLLTKAVVDSMIPKIPTYDPGKFTPATPGAQWQKPLAYGGLNPGFITATPYYQTTSPVQAQYYWGAHNPSPGETNMWNTPIAAAPATPWGIQQGPSPLNIQQLINSQLTNPVNQTPVAPVAPVAPK